VASEGKRKFKQCKECERKKRNEYNRSYARRYMKRYYSTPEGKKKRNRRFMEWYARPENKKKVFIRNSRKSYEKAVEDFEVKILKVLKEKQLPLTLAKPMLDIFSQYRLKHSKNTRVAELMPGFIWLAYDVANLEKPKYLAGYRMHDIYHAVNMIKKHVNLDTHIDYEERVMSLLPEFVENPEDYELRVYEVMQELKELNLLGGKAPNSVSVLAIYLTLASCSKKAVKYKVANACNTTVETLNVMLRQYYGKK
jgi:hypothetical protein